ncbi:MAG TPA: hypothetical protein VFU97_24510 [Xanthobacteraceae bacterium]|nr:hypothetical protein [Xanthobacteraceae bacterium]
MTVRDELLEAGVLRQPVPLWSGRATLRQDARGRADAARAIVAEGMGQVVLESNLADPRIKPFVERELQRMRSRGL